MGGEQHLHGLFQGEILEADGDVAQHVRIGNDVQAIGLREQGERVRQRHVLRPETETRVGELGGQTVGASGLKGHAFFQTQRRARVLRLTDRHALAHAEGRRGLGRLVVGYGRTSGQRKQKQDRRRPPSGRRRKHRKQMEPRTGRGNHGASRTHSSSSGRALPRGLSNDPETTRASRPRADLLRIIGDSGKQRTDTRESDSPMARRTGSCLALSHAWHYSSCNISINRISTDRTVAARPERRSGPRRDGPRADVGDARQAG